MYNAYNQGFIYFSTKKKKKKKKAKEENSSNQLKEKERKTQFECRHIIIRWFVPIQETSSNDLFYYVKVQM
jgi:hypothetical protein